jgi:hypothetical protein
MFLIKTKGALRQIDVPEEWEKVITVSKAWSRILN